MHKEARKLSSEIFGIGYHGAEEKDKLDEAVRILDAAINLENTLTASPSDFGIDELKNSNQISQLGKIHWLRFDRGRCNLVLGNCEKAVEDFTAELVLHKNGEGFYRSLYERANANKMMERYDLAITDFLAAKNIEGADPKIISFSNFEIAEINSKNTIWNNAVKSVNSFRSSITNLSVPTSILWFQKPIEDKFLELGEEKIGRILNQIFDLKKTDSSEFSQFLKELDIVAEPSQKNPLSENLKIVFERLSGIKGSASTDSASEEFITLFEQNTRKACANKLESLIDKVKSSSSEVKSLEVEKIIRDRGNEL